MEMHQVRYFLAVARTLNFTRAAEECNVAQPSLTRAIKLLEGELGGDLFRRERPHAMLTPLGERMYPLLKQCYESAQAARALAAQINDGEVGALKLAVSSSIELSLILTQVNELRKNFNEIELKILRGTGPQLVEYMKSGEAELAIASSIGEAWDRLDTWKLFDESFDMVFSRAHRLANQETIQLDDLKPERFLLRSHCERSTDLAALLKTKGLNADHRHEVSSDQDLLALLEANIGIGFLPRTVSSPQTVVRTTVEGLELGRTVCLYGVAGRQRSPIAATFMKMLRAAKWPHKTD
ncbi:LysR family transcriptional regulator [Pseudorhodoplanes sinuspersici]|uniref:Transcriptional regulator n=1 Tax=Pseudorhodoplanes sinuspersici TaxID=1235591 RepID=A0A1W6ZKG2_9HYPH|nr:LysR family transcriptional regulator [Pseudorhodoplanes sinuspersici]ARP97876.1 transcriptional regulator [Pseudorhodoplanes sinuspersici]RKE68388.1 DNA-binding transcriptional LysR family regulator [Pseudorhodoplanes sinuspersici]